MTEPIDLPPEFERLADLLSEQPAELRDLFRYALVLAIIGDEKARMTGTRIDGDRECPTFQTVGGDVFEITRPPISDEVKTELINHVRADYRGRLGLVAGGVRQASPLVVRRVGHRTVKR